MAVDKPVGDNARKGAVKKRSQLKNKLMGDAWTKRDKLRGIYGGEKEREEIQGRAAGKGVNDDPSPLVNLQPGDETRED